MRVAMDQKLAKSAGREVEVCYKGNGFGSIWYKAIIELTAPTKPRSKRGELCVRLLKDDSVTLFNNVLVRPVPPAHVESRIDVEEGCVVDVSRQNEWWTGLVIEVIEKGKFLVFFDSPVPPDVIQFERKDLRPHLYWVDEKHWTVRGPNLKLLKRLTEESMFSSGTMVEVSCKINKVEVVWVPAMVVKEFEEGDKETEEEDEETEEGNEETEETDKEDDEENDDDNDDEENKEDDEENDEDDDEIEEENEKIVEDEKKLIVKFCYKTLSCKDDKAKPNKTVGLRSIRPTPPSFWVEEYQLMEYVEALHGTRWRQGIVMGFLSQKRNLVLLEATNEELVFKHSDLRPLKVWEDGVWKTKDLPLTQASGNKSVTNGTTPTVTKESDPPVTPSLVVTEQPLKQAEAETQGKTPKRTLLRMRNQNGLENDATRENENSKGNNRKRKREQSASVEETSANDSTADSPFEKKLSSMWKNVQSMEAFKKVPQTPRFRPLVEIEEDSRETFAIGMMFTYYALTEEAKALQSSSPISQLKGLRDSFAVLEKHGFDVKEPQSRIHKRLSLKERQAKLKEESQRAEKEIAERESEKVEVERKLLQLQRMKDELNKEMAQMKSSAELIEQELEDMELQ